MSKNAVSVTGIVIAILMGLGMAYLGSMGGVVANGLPIFAVGVALSFVIQWIVFIPAFMFSSEKFFDLTGSLTYISLVMFAAYLVPEMTPRDYLIAGLVLVWAFRLGQFLFRRVLQAGEDRRFRTMKTDFLQFLMTWTLQGLWVSITLGAGLAAMTSESKVNLGVMAYIGLALWVLGFAIEVIADAQKTRFRAVPEHQDLFIQTGLWAWSRHPNYFGEILLWFGMALIAFPALQGGQYATLISPIFVFVLMTYISGVRMLEARADRKWGDDKTYQDYKARTPVLWLKPPSKS
jgi:steroid 5-alpha reductase family enzyme